MFYKKFILPRLINYACKGSTIQKQREKVIHKAEGNVLEIGIGSALNFPYYDWEKIKSFSCIDPSPELWELRDKTLDPENLNLNFQIGSADDLPFDNGSFDTVVSTYCFCSIENLHIALTEIKRVLKPNGQLIFSEHVLSEDPKVSRFQNKLNPIWLKFSGGCNLNRDTKNILLSEGFEFSEYDEMFLPGPKFANWHIWGISKVYIK